jgi:parallel beta-helix repeat protein
MLAVLGALLLIGGSAMAQTDPPATGDWTVSDTTVVINRTVDLHGNLTVTSGGDLTLTNVTLRVHSSAANANGILVEAGGTLHLEDHDGVPDTVGDWTWIYRGAPAWGYFFLAEAGADLIVERTVVSGAGDGSITGGLLVYANDSVIRQSVIDSGQTSGLSAEDCSGLLVEDTTFSRSDDGLVLDGATQAIVRRSTFVDNSKAGARLLDATSITFEDCTVIDNTLEGIIVLGGSNVTIRTSTITDNNWGLVMDDVDKILLEDSEVARIPLSAILMREGTSNVRLENVTINETQRSCVEGEGIDNLTIDSCELFDADYYGVRILNGSRSLVMRNNRIHNNSYDGIHIGRASDVWLEGNIIVNNGYNGLNVIDSLNLSMRRNIVSWNNYDGIKLDRVSDAIMDSTELAGNNYSGIFIKAGTQNTTIIGSTLRDNVRSGIILDSVSDIALESSNLSDNGRSGIIIEGGCDSISLTDCILGGNEATALDIEDSTNVSLESCTLSSPPGPLGRTVSLYNSDHVTLSNSTITGQVVATWDSLLTIISPTTLGFTPSLGAMSRITLSYWVDAYVIWPDLTPVEGATVEGHPTASSLVYVSMTNDTGITPLMALHVKIWSDVSTVDANPYKFFAQKGEVRANNDTSILGNTRVVIVLQDTIAPIANATDLVAEIGFPTELNGSASSDNTGLAAWEWTFDDGIGIVVLDGQWVNWTFKRLGTFTGELRVFDFVGLSDAVSFNISVVDTTPPLVDLNWTLTVKQGTTVEFNATVIEDNDPTLLTTGSFSWSIHMGLSHNPLAILDGPLEFYTFTVMGTFRIKLHVIDQSGNHGTNWVAVMVLDGEVPVVDAGPDIETEQGARVDHVPLSMEDNDPEFDDTAMVWWLVEGPGIDLNLTGVEVNWTPLEIGVYQVILMVMDAGGNVGIDVLLVTAQDGIAPTVAAGQDRTVPMGGTVTLSAEGTTDNDPAFPDGAIFHWRVTGPPDLDLERNGFEVTLLLPWVGEYIAVLTVTDGAGNSASDVLTITSIDDSAPYVEAFSPGPEELSDDGEVTISMTLSDVGTGLSTTALEYRWREDQDSGWSDWSSIEILQGGNTVTTSFTLTLPWGASVVELRAQDMAGNALDDGDGHVIRVNSGPEVVVLSPTEGADYGPFDTILLSASGTRDVDEGDQLSFKWSSDIDGPLGSKMERPSPLLTPGAHRITLIVSDGIPGHEVAVTVNITVRPIPSTVDAGGEFPWLAVLLLALSVVALGAALRERRRRSPPNEALDQEEGPQERPDEEEEEEASEGPGSEGDWVPMDKP